MSSLLLVMGVGYLLAFFWRRMGAGARVQTVALVAAVAAAGALFYYVIYPHNPVRMKMAGINFASPRAVATAIADRWYLVPKALAIWGDHPWFGVGGWGFRSLLAQYVDRSEWPKYLWRGAANVHNDGAQFLAEHGAVGAGLMLALAALPAAFGLRALRRSLRLSPADAYGGGRWRRLPPGALLACGGLLCTCLHSMVDLPFRAPAVLTAWALVLAGLPALMPAEASRPQARAASEEGAA
jgi:O-antigen ligase